jgi:hypothetical protein
MPDYLRIALGDQGPAKQQWISEWQVAAKRR